MWTWIKTSIIKPISLYLRDFSFQPFSFYYFNLGLDDDKSSSYFINLFVVLLLLPFNIAISLFKILVALVALAVVSVGCLATLIIDGKVSQNKSIYTLLKSIGHFAIENIVLFFVDLYASVVNIGKLMAGIFKPSIGKTVISNHYSPFSQGTTETILKKGFIVDNLYLGLLTIRYLFADKITTHGLNPDRLTDAQKKFPPTICVHGYGHNQSAWVPLAENLSENKYGGAVFTINVPSESHLDFDNYTDSKEWKESLRLLRELWGQIREKYPENMNAVNLIGHSRGSWMITSLFAEFEQAGIKVNAISLDNMFFPRNANTITHQHIISDNTVNTHTTMLCDTSVLQQCRQFLLATSINVSEENSPLVKDDVSTLFNNETRKKQSEDKQAYLSSSPYTVYGLNSQPESHDSDTSANDNKTETRPLLS